MHLLRLCVDYELCRPSSRALSIRWAPRDWDQGWGYQNPIVDPEAFERWFYEDTCAGSRSSWRRSRRSGAGLMI